MLIYHGPIDLKLMTKEAARAYRSYADQKRRCTKQSHPDYKWYGAKGIQVKYSAREFVGWWLNQISKKSFKKPTVGRIDHSNNYELGNIELVEFIDNLKEAKKRNGSPIKPIVRMSDSGEEIAIFQNCSRAAEFYNIKRINVWFSAAKNVHYSKQKFKFAEDYK